MPAQWLCWLSLPARWSQVSTFGGASDRVATRVRVAKRFFRGWAPIDGAMRGQVQFDAATDDYRVRSMSLRMLMRVRAKCTRLQIMSRRWWRLEKLNFAEKLDYSLGKVRWLQHGLPRGSGRAGKFKNRKLPRLHQLNSKCINSAFIWKDLICFLISTNAVKDFLFLKFFYTVKSYLLSCSESCASILLNAGREAAF